MQQHSQLSHQEGATNVHFPDAAVDLAFLEEFLGEDLDIDDALLPADHLFDPDLSGDLRSVKPACHTCACLQPSM